MNNKSRWKLAQYFEIRWWKSYAKSQNPQYLKDKKRYWQSVLDKIEPPIKTTDISAIDVGCGPAGMYIMLENADITAVDPLLQSYENELSFFSRKMYPWVKFNNISFEAFNTINSFDVVFCLNALNHFENLEESVKKLCKLTNSGGRLIVSLDVHKKTWLKKIFASGPFDVLHPHQKTEQEYLHLFYNHQMKLTSQNKLKGGRIFDYNLYSFEKA